MARSLNSMLMGFSRVETFVTAFIAKIDLKTGRATYCSAGHPPTMVISQSRCRWVAARPVGERSSCLDANRA